MQNFLGLGLIAGWEVFKTNLISSLANLVLMLIYNILRAILYIIEFAEYLFKALAGIGSMTFNIEGSAKNEDLLYAFITNDTVQDAFFTLLGFSVVLLVILTIVAMVKSEFTMDVKNAAKMPILTRAFKAISQFFIVPIFVLLGVVTSTALTRVVYNALLASGKEVSVSAYCFKVGASSANRARNDSGFANFLKKGLYLANSGSGNKEDKSLDDNIFDNEKDVADLVDAYMTGQTDDLGISAIEYLSKDGSFSDAETEDAKVTYKINRLAYYEYSIEEAYNLWTKGKASSKTKGGSLNVGSKGSDGYYYFAWQTYLVGTPKAKTDDSACNKPYLDATLVNYYYDLTKFDFVLAIGCACILAWNFLCICLALLKRVFEMTILFLLTPAAIALGPIDGGKAYGAWRSEIMKRLFAVIGPVFAFSIFLTIVNLIGNVVIFKGSSGFSTALSNLFDLFFHTIAIIVASSLLKTTSGFISSFLGVSDLLSEGNNLMGSAGKTLSRAALVTTGVGAAVGMAGKTALNAGKTVFKGTASAVKGLAGSVSSMRSDEWRTMRKNKKDLKKINKEIDQLASSPEIDDPDSQRYHDLKAKQQEAYELESQNEELKGKLKSGDVHTRKHADLQRKVEEAQKKYDETISSNASSYYKQNAKWELEGAKSALTKQELKDLKYNKSNKRSAVEREDLKGKVSDTAKLAKEKVKKNFEKTKKSVGETIGNVFTPEYGWKSVVSRFAGGFGGEDNNAIKLFSMFGKKDGRKAFYQSAYEKKKGDKAKEDKEKEKAEKAEKELYDERQKKQNEALTQAVGTALDDKLTASLEGIQSGQDDLLKGIQAGQTTLSESLKTELEGIAAGNKSLLEELSKIANKIPSSEKNEVKKGTILMLDGTEHIPGTPWDK